MSQRERRDYRSLGEILADARSERKLTVQQVSDKTKIAPRMITSLENDELENLSGPVYARGFLRSLCQLYGLDHAWMMSKLEAGMETTSPTPVTSVVAPPPPSSASEPEPAEEAPSGSGGPSEQTWKIETVDGSRVRRIRPKSRRRIPNRVWGILLVLIALVVLVLFGRSLFGGDSSAWPSLALEHDTTADSPSPEQPESVSFAEISESDQEPSPPSGRGSESTATGSTRERPGSGTDAKVEPDRPSVEKQGPAEPAPARVVDSAGTESDGAERVLYRDQGSDGLPSVVRPDDRAESKPSSLEIRARGLVEIWVQIDDREEHQRTLRAGDAVRYSGYRKFVLEISDNSAVVVELDGIRREPPFRLETSWVLHANAPASE